MDETRDEFTKSSSELALVEQQLAHLRLDEFAKSYDYEQKKSSLPNDELNLRRFITLANSVTKNSTVTYPEIATLRADLGRTCKEECAKRDLHHERCQDLQCTWDKLVNLRSHISYFRSAIEQVTIEEVCSQTAAAVKGITVTTGSEEISLNDELAKSGHFVESTSHIISLQIIREEVRTRDQINSRLTEYEKSLSEMRLQLSHLTSRLMEISELNSKKPQTDIYSARINSSLEYAMSIRAKIGQVTDSIRKTENLYLAAQQELVNVEADLSNHVKQLSLGEIKQDLNSAIQKSNMFMQTADTNAVGLFSWSQNEGTRSIRESANLQGSHWNHLGNNSLSERTMLGDSLVDSQADTKAVAEVPAVAGK